MCLEKMEHLDLLDLLDRGDHLGLREWMLVIVLFSFSYDIPWEKDWCTDLGLTPDISY